MSTYEKFYLVTAVILFILNMAMMVRNLVVPGGKPWIALLNLVGALAIGLGFVNVLTGALA